MLVVRIRWVCVYIVSEVCSEWTHKKLFVYVFLYAVQTMAPHTRCMIVLLNYIKAFLLPPLHILFASNDCISTSSIPPAVILVLSLITAGVVLSYIPLPPLYSLLNHYAVINKNITHPQFLHIAFFTTYISFDVIVIALAPVCFHLLHTHKCIIIIRFTK